MNKLSRFWIVMKVPEPPCITMAAAKQHETAYRAWNEAERLCKKEGRSFYVFSLEGVAQLAETPVVLTKAED